MRAFRFSLQRVLDVRGLIEEQRRQAVFRAQAEVTACAQELEAIKAARRTAAAQGRPDGDSVDPGLQALGWQHRAVLYQRATALQAELARRQAALEEARSHLVAAVKERRVLERLKERRRLAHAREAARREQVLSDDLASQRAARTGRRDDGRQRG
ncbi:MAG: flagellar export protein FliJ [Limnochordales bacterium]|nr:flagellar export protein FliJ [Limnochordales bacterium]